MTDKVGFIGLGNIGALMARNVLEAGFKLVAYDIRAEARAQLVKAGAQAADFPRSVARSVSSVCLSLPTLTQVEEVCFGVDGLVDGASAGAIVIDLTSGNPTQTAMIGAWLRKSGFELIDAGVSGGVPGAEQGTLGIMVGGSVEA
jgi:3-hydroxyisobutyrate dehydrogenase-like beta-hydroxyacid dehydrogenase